MLNWIKLHPAAITGAVVALVNFLIAYGVNLTQDQAASIATIAGAVVTIVITVSTRPVGLQLVTGSVVTIIGALSAFHFHLSPDQISSGSTILLLVLGVAFHYAHVPVAAARNGKTADGLQLARVAGR